MRSMNKKSKQLKKINVLLAFAVFATVLVAGLYLIFNTYAATSKASIELEATDLTKEAMRISDSTASGGQAIVFGKKRSYGVLQNTVANIDNNRPAGINTAYIGMSWRSYEPTKGNFSSTYMNQVKSQIEQYRSNDMDIVLSFGVQYAPDWVLGLPNARFVNQYGDPYADTSPGKNIANLVFNNAIRGHYETYMQKVFTDLGTDFYAVRVGGGWYGEVNYPDPNYNGRMNSYWGFDAIAAGQVTGLPTGVNKNPVPNWRPGMSSGSANEARQFIEWYLESQKNYHDWQITTTRKYFAGNLHVLYPGAGIRAGQIDKAVEVNLNGSTGPEQNGEIQKGLDYARFIASIKDKKVYPYTTWLEAKWSGMDDSSTNQGAWSPIKLISYHAALNPLKLQVSGENGGRDSFDDMQHTFQQASKYNLDLVLWAFESDLYSGQYATLEQLKSMIQQYP